jgi:host factor-I protein
LIPALTKAQKHEIATKFEIPTMAAKNPHRLQNEFLTHLIKERTPVTIFLLNGVKLQGNIAGFDDFCISITREGQLQAVYKQEISTISTATPVTLWEDPDAPPARKPSARLGVKAMGGRAGAGVAPRKVVVERVRRIPGTRSR